MNHNIQPLYDLVGNVYQDIDTSGEPCFTVFEDDFSTVESIVINNKPNIVLELGSYSGYSSCLLGKQLERWNGKLICVDTWLGNPGVWLNPVRRPSLRMKNGRPQIYQTFLENVKKLSLCDTIIPLSQTSSNAGEILKHLNINVDLIFWDCGHSGLYQDLCTFESILSPQGFWIGDDYGQYPEIQQQIDQFLCEKSAWKFDNLGQGRWTLTRT